MDRLCTIIISKAIKASCVRVKNRIDKKWQEADDDGHADVNEDWSEDIDHATRNPNSTLDPVYEAKARVLNRAVC